MDPGIAAHTITRTILNQGAAMRVPFTHSLAKTGTFAIVHFTVAFSIAYLLTGSVAIAGALALLEPVANTAAFLLHERAWARFTPQPTASATPAPQRTAETSC
jgi:uncharacterized membrane protein